MIGKTTGIEKSVFCTAAVATNTIAMPGADDHTFSTATGVGDLLTGVFQHSTTAGGQQVRLMLSGVSIVKIGGNVTRGNWITSDGSGQGVAAAPSAGANNNVIGKALASGVSGDLIPVLLDHCSLQG